MDSEEQIIANQGQDNENEQNQIIEKQVDHIQGCIYGALLGDAIGKGLNNENPASRKNTQIDVVECMNLRRVGMLKLHPLQLSNYGEVIMTLGTVIMNWITNKKIDFNISATAYREWYNKVPVNLSPNMGKVLLRTYNNYDVDESEIETLFRNEAYQLMNQDFSDDCLARIAPLAIAIHTFDENIIDLIIKNEVSLTNADITSQNACVIYSFLIKYLIENFGDIQASLNLLNLRIQQLNDPELKLWFQKSFQEEVEMELKEVCDIKSSFIRSLWLLFHSQKFNQAIEIILYEAGETNSLCIIAGSLIGAAYGFSELPQDNITYLYQFDVLQAEDVKKRPEEFNTSQIELFLEKYIMELFLDEQTANEIQTDFDQRYPGDHQIYKQPEIRSNDNSIQEVNESEDEIENEKERLRIEKEKENERLRIEKEKENERLRIEKENENERLRLQKEIENEIEKLRIEEENQQQRLRLERLRVDDENQQILQAQIKQEEKAQRKVDNKSYNLPFTPEQQPLLLDESHITDQSTGTHTQKTHLPISPNQEVKIENPQTKIQNEKISLGPSKSNNNPSDRDFDILLIEQRYEFPLYSAPILVTERFILPKNRYNLFDDFKSIFLITEEGKHLNGNPNKDTFVFKCINLKSLVRMINQQNNKEFNKNRTILTPQYSPNSYYTPYFNPYAYQTPSPFLNAYEINPFSYGYQY